jgi:hypothetical protein
MIVHPENASSINTMLASPAQALKASSPSAASSQMSYGVP